MDVVGTIALALLTSFVASALFLLSLTRIRPKFAISPQIARSVRGEELSYAIKVINRTRFDLIDVRARLENLVIIAGVNNPLTRRRHIPLRFSEILVLSKYDRDDRQADYAFRFTTASELSVRTLGKNTIIRFSIIAKHSLSGFSSASEQRYGLTDIVDGTFATGDSLSITPLDDEDLRILRRLLQS